MVKEKDILLKEIHHRVKNNLQIIESLLNLQASKINDAKYLDFFISYTRRIHTIASVENSLYGEKNLDSIDFKKYVPGLIDFLRSKLLKEKAEPEFHYEIDRIRLTVNKAIPCALIINEAVSNSMMHAFPSGRHGFISVKFVYALKRGHYFLEICDNGIGLPADVDICTAPTLGLELIKVLTEQINGELAVASERGTRYSIVFPN